MRQVLGSAWSPKNEGAEGVSKEGGIRCWGPHGDPMRQWQPGCLRKEPAVLGPKKQGQQGCQIKEMAATGVCPGAQRCGACSSA